MTKLVRIGSLDNNITYEHICDTTADLETIDPEQINLGSIALVIEGTAGIEIYIANSQKEWTLFV